MTRVIELNAFGLEFFVEVEYEEEYPKCGVSNVVCVSAATDDGVALPLKCDTERFAKDFEGELQQALEESLQSDILAHGDAMYDCAKEEGLL